MRFLVAATLAALFAAGAHAQPMAPVPPIPFDERVLPNGLRVITSVDRTTPNVTVQVWYDVGGKDDPPGRSGFAHLFEHMMFKATRDMPPEYLDRLTEDVGGMNNAFTEDDATAFYEVIPATDLQRLIWAEAERMSALVVDKANFDSERQVVEEELRQRVLADPYGRLFEELIPASTFAVHPYRRSPIGSIADLDAASLDDVQRFHATYYRPDNATLVVVGNFDPAELTAWIDKYFGPLQDPSTPIPRVTAEEPPRQAPATFVGYGPDVPLPALVISWLGPDAASADAPALEVLDAVLTTGKSSRLYETLVYRRQIAQQVFSSVDLRAQLGMIYFGAIAAPGRTLDEIETALDAEVADLRARPVSPQALDRAKTQLLTAEIRQRETIEGRASELGSAQAVEGAAARANTDIIALAAVTAADVERVARAYLADDRRVLIRYLPQSERPPGAPPAAPGPPPASSRPYIGPVATLLPAGERAEPPPTGPQPPTRLPRTYERRLANGLRVIVAKSSDLPLVSVSLSVLGGTGSDPAGLAGDAALTAAVAVEGTHSRSAREIASQSEAVGADLSASAGMDDSSISISVTPAKLQAAMTILADVAENASFAPEEIERARKSVLESLDLAYGDPAEVAALASTPIAYAGTPFAHAAEGVPASLKRLRRADLVRFHARFWRPDNAVLVLTGDITPDQGFVLAKAALGAWPRPLAPLPPSPAGRSSSRPRYVVIDLPGAGQAVVLVAGPAIARSDRRFFEGLVANAVLGGGYSARLNEEIRVRRGLSYGAGSELAAHRSAGAFTAQASTRNEAATEVADLTLASMASLGGAPPAQNELAARKASLVGEHGRMIATTDGLAEALSALAVDGVGLDQLGTYDAEVQAVTPAEVQAFARRFFQPADASLIVAGEAKDFLPALKRRFPGLEVIPIDIFAPDDPSLTAAGQ